jgi:hypothetical protein
MIDRQTQPLNAEEERDFRLWLSKPQFGTLVKVAESAMKNLAAQALEDAVKSGVHSLKIEAANHHLQEAARYQTFLTILLQFRNNEQPFLITKLS